MKRFLSKKGGLWIAVWTFLFIAAKSQAEYLKFAPLNVHSQFRKLSDSGLSEYDQPKVNSGLKGAVRFSLGLGRHDNLTKAKSWTGPEAKTSNTYWDLYIELGPAYKRASASIFMDLMMPLPRSKNVSGYNHKAELLSFGNLIYYRLFSMKSRINLTPMLGHKLYREIASIYDPQGDNPDSLNLGYSDNGMLFGLEFQCSFRNSGRESQQRLVFRYLHESLRGRVDRYRLEWRYIEFEEEPGIVIFDQFGYISIGLEHTRYSAGRSDWFIIGSFAVELK